MGKLWPVFWPKSTVYDNPSSRLEGFVDLTRTSHFNSLLVEVIWVLSRGYKYSREEIVSAVEKLLQVKELAVQNPGEVWEALHLYRDSKVGFADLYIAVLNREEGYSPTLTFDKKAARTDLFELV